MALSNIRYRDKLVLVLVSFLLLAPFAQAQEMPTNVLYMWDDFSGGLNTKLSEYALPKNQATIAENVRFGTKLKSLTKRDEVFSYGSMDASEAGTSLHRLYLKDVTKVLIGTHGDEIETGNDSTGTFTTILDLTSGDYRWQWLTWHDIAIGCDGQNQPVKYDGSSASATYLGSLLATLDTSGTGPASGAYTYKVSYYTSTYEVLFNQASNTFTADGNDVLLSMIPIAPTTYGGESIIGRKIYRTKSAGSTYFLLSNGAIANNTAVTLTDSDTDAEVTATTYPAGDDTYRPPKGRFPVIHKNRLWFANDPSNPSRIYYSEDGSHEVFVENSLFNIRPNDGDMITFAKNLLGRLVISKNNTIQYLYTHKGPTPSSDWEISDPFSFIGCQAPYSAVNSPMGIIYLAWDGIYRFNGQISILISDAVSPEIRDISESDLVNCWGEFHKSIYYLAYTSEKTGSSTNDRILLLDIISNAYEIDIFSVNAFTTFNSGDDWDILYSTSSENGTVFAHAETVKGIIHRRHADFTGTFDDVRYIPTSVGGDSKSPVLEIARTATIDELTGTIDNLTGDINREDTEGHYVSQVLESGASALDKLYWHETIPGAGGDITFSLRSGATSAAVSDFTACTADNSTDKFTDGSGHSLADGERVEINATVLPTGISDEILYYVIGVAGNDFQVSLTSGGSAVDFSSNGTSVTYKEWTNTYTNPTGSDISGESANTFLQYRIDFSTDDIDYTPNVYFVGGYTVKITYSTDGTTQESSVPLHWRGGWTDLGYPGYVKSLKKIYVYHEYTENASGTLTLKFSNFEGDSDTFDIDMLTYPEYYTERFTTGFFNGELFNLDITEDSLNDINIDKVIVVFDVQPLT